MRIFEFKASFIIFTKFFPYVFIGRGHFYKNLILNYIESKNGYNVEAVVVDLNKPRWQGFLLREILKKNNPKVCFIYSKNKKKTERKMKKVLRGFNLNLLFKVYKNTKNNQKGKEIVRVLLKDYKKGFFIRYVSIFLFIFILFYSVGGVVFSSFLEETRGILRLYKAYNYIYKTRLFVDNLGTLEKYILFKHVYTCSKREGIDPLLTLCVIYAESNFLRKNVSYVGATGYMQILPAAWGDKYPHLLNDTIKFHTEMNIMAGTQILSYYLKKNNYDLFASLYSYNAGGFKFKILPNTKRTVVITESFFYVKKIINLYFEIKNHLEDGEGNKKASFRAIKQAFLNLLMKKKLSAFKTL